MQYYNIQEAEQFTFYRIPKTLFTNPKYKGLSTDAKVLYGLLLDRMSLSIKNKWCDDMGRVFIFFSRNEVMELLNIGNQKVTKLFKQLKEYSLIDEKVQGLNRPNIIYVCKFIDDNITSKPVNKGIHENHISDNVKITSQAMLKSHANYTDNNNNTNINNKSFILSIPNTIGAEKGMNERMNENQSNNNPPTTKKPPTPPSDIITGQLDINNIQSNQSAYDNKIDELNLDTTYNDTDTIQAIKDALLTIYTSKEIQGHSQSIIHSNFSRIDIDVIEQGLNNFNQAASNTVIKNTNKYLSSCIYQAISKVSSNKLNISRKIEFMNRQ